MKLKTQYIYDPNEKTARVEIGFDCPGARHGVAVLAYDNPVEALNDACALVETALQAVRRQGVAIA